MAIYSKSTFGKISGKLGEAVGSKWRNIQYVRSLPTKSAKAPTEAQLAVYAKFTLSAARLSPIKEILYLGFGDKKLNKSTGYNAAVKAFLANSIIGDYPNYEVDYPKLQLSKGSLAPLTSLQLTFDSSTLSVTWTADFNWLNCFADDQVLVVVYNQNSNLYILNDEANREAQNVDFELSANSGDVLHAWAFCLKRDLEKVSPSQYIGTFTA